MEFWSEEFEEEFTELWEKHIPVYMTYRCLTGSVALPIVGDS